MSSKSIKAKSGFAILKTVLVLAIASLVALPSTLSPTQSSQTDTVRRNDLAKLAAAITQYQANNSGKLPTDTSFVSNYLDGDFIDPGTKKAYNVSIFAYSSEETAPRNTGEIYIVTGAKCNGGKITKATNDRSYATLMKLGNDGVYCMDNQ